MELPNISSEGGPLLLVDVQHLHAWHGVEGKDYDRACDVVGDAQTPDGGTILIAGEIGLIWDIGGAGTAFIVNPIGEFPVLFRYWSESDLGEDEIEKIVTEINWSAGKEIGVLAINSGRLAVVWAVENGSGLELPLQEGRFQGDTSTEESGFVIMFPSGRYVGLFVKGSVRGVAFRGLSFRPVKK